MWAELAILLLTVAALLVMAFLFDAPLRERANPDFAENPAKSPWYFLGIQELVSYSAFAGGVIIPVLFLVFLISIPYMDREEQNIGIWFSGTSREEAYLAIPWLFIDQYHVVCYLSWCVMAGSGVGFLIYHR